MPLIFLLKTEKTNVSLKAFYLRPKCWKQGEGEDLMEGSVTHFISGLDGEGCDLEVTEGSHCSMWGRGCIRADFSGTCQNRCVFRISLGGKGHRLTDWFISEYNSLSRSKAFTFYGLQSIKAYRASVCFQMGEYSFWSRSYSVCRKQIYCIQGEECVLVCVTVEVRGPIPSPQLSAVESTAGSQVGFWQQEAGNWTTPCLQSVFDGSCLISLLSWSILRYFKSCPNHMLEMNSFYTLWTQKYKVA